MYTVDTQVQVPSTSIYNIFYSYYTQYADDEFYFILHVALSVFIFFLFFLNSPTCRGAGQDHFSGF